MPDKKLIEQQKIALCNLPNTEAEMELGKGKLYLMSCIDGCLAVVCINYSLVTPVNRQMQSDG